jgi:hypothetical protein
LNVTEHSLSAIAANRADEKLQKLCNLLAIRALYYFAAVPGVFTSSIDLSCPRRREHQCVCGNSKLSDRRRFYEAETGVEQVGSPFEVNDDLPNSCARSDCIIGGAPAVDTCANYKLSPEPERNLTAGSLLVQRKNGLLHSDRSVR